MQPGAGHSVAYITGWWYLNWTSVRKHALSTYVPALCEGRHRQKHADEGHWRLATHTAGGHWGETCRRGNNVSSEAAESVF